MPPSFFSLVALALVIVAGADVVTDYSTVTELREESEALTTFKAVCMLDELDNKLYLFAFTACAGFVMLSFTTFCMRSLQMVSDGVRLDKTSGRDLIETAMTRGWWGLAEVVAKEGRTQGVDLSSAVHQAATAVQKKLAALTDSLQKASASEGCACFS